MVTHSNYNSPAQQEVSEKRSVTVSSEAHQRNLVSPDWSRSRFEAKQNIYLHENVCNRFRKWRKESLFSALTEISAADTQDDLEVFW